MSSGHIGVEGFDGVGSCHFAVFFVHVVGSGAGVVTDPDTKILHFERTLFVDLMRHISIASSSPGFFPP